MGQQQLLLIILGTIIVGIAVAVGITMFNDQAAATNRDEVSNDLVHYASAAQAYYRRPRILGGGGGSFTGMTMRSLTAVYQHPQHLNGSYSLDPDPVGGAPAFVTLTGEGTETGNDGVNKIKVVMYVYRDSVKVDGTLGN
jgi:hypothetical protein